MKLIFETSGNYRILSVCIGFDQNLLGTSETHSSKKKNEEWKNLSKTANVNHSIPGPFREPVDGAAVDERREHSTSRSERIADRTHAQDDVKIVTDPTDEVVENAVSEWRERREQAKGRHRQKL